jgi:hypothetical protein
VHAVSDDMTRLGWSLPGDPVTLAVICEPDDVDAVRSATSHATATRTQAVERPSLADGYFEGSSAKDPLPQVNTNFEDGSIGHLGV